MKDFSSKYIKKMMMKVPVKPPQEQIFTTQDHRELRKQKNPPRKQETI